MSENLKQPLDSWLESQQAYWKALSEANDDIQPPERWAEAIKRHQDSSDTTLPPQFSQLIDVLGAQSENFSTYGADLLKQRSANDDEQSTRATLKTFQRYILKQTTELLIRQWQLPGQITDLFKTHSVSDEHLVENPFISGIKSLLESTATHSNPELQARSRKGLTLIVEYQEALSAYIEHYRLINQAATCDLEKKLTNQKTPVDTLHGLHSLWVNCYESAYSEAVFKQAYQTAHGRISNALMSLQHFTQDTRNTYWQSLGLATQKSINTVLDRQHKMRKEMRQANQQIDTLSNSVEALQAQMASNLLSEMREELVALRQEVALLKNKRER
ncbi:MAG: poly(R)-hydroxyalkanoic acid synthase subunit PhaE [Pontibacterium sp.]